MMDHFFSITVGGAIKSILLIKPKLEPKAVLFYKIMDANSQEGDGTIGIGDSAWDQKHVWPVFALAA